MAADLIHPVIFLVACLLVIDYLDMKMPLLVLTILTIPVSLLFTLQVNAGLYEYLFETDITAFQELPGITEIIMMCMWSVPITAILKTYYLKRFVTKEEDKDII